MQDLIPVTFHGDSLYLIDFNGIPYAPMRPIVEGMGLAWQVQHRKLAARFATSVTEMVTQMPGDDQRRLVTCLPLRKLPGWLMTISPNKVSPELRPKILAYQEECDDALWDYWTTGRATRPASTDTGHRTPPHSTLTERLRRAADLIDQRAELDAELATFTDLPAWAWSSSQDPLPRPEPWPVAQPLPDDEERILTALCHFLRTNPGPWTAGGLERRKGGTKGPFACSMMRLRGIIARAVVAGRLRRIPRGRGLGYLEC